MTTKLDELVGYLAGHAGDPRIIEELADPSSDASLFLEGTRLRSRALVEEPVEVQKPSRRSRPRSWIGWILGLIGLLSLIFSMIFGLRLIDAKLQRIVDDQRRRDAEGRATATRIEAAIDQAHQIPPDLSPIVSAIARLEASLGKLDDRLMKIENSPAPTAKPDPIVAQVRDDLANLRVEIAAGEKFRIRKVEELQASVHEVSRVLRLLLGRLEPVPPTNPEPGGTFPQPPRVPGSGTPRIQP